MQVCLQLMTPLQAQAAELAAEQRQREEEARQAAIVAAEKERLLREAPPALAPFLPRGLVAGMAGLGLGQGPASGAGHGGRPF